MLHLKCTFASYFQPATEQLGDIRDSILFLFVEFDRVNLFKLVLTPKE